MNEVLTSASLARVVDRLRREYGRFDWKKLQQHQITVQGHVEHVHMKFEANNNSGKIALADAGATISQVLNPVDAAKMETELAALAEASPQASAVR